MIICLYISEQRLYIYEKWTEETSLETEKSDVSSLEEDNFKIKL